MKNLLGKAALFTAGMITGALILQPGNAQQNPSGLRLNHVGIYAKDYDETYNFYTKVLGLREAFSVKDKDGKPTLTYLQINREQFLELAPSTPDRPAGLNHVGIWPENSAATIDLLRRRGAKVDDPRVGSTGSSITNVVDPNGVRLELVNFLPDSLPSKAIAAWK